MYFCKTLRGGAEVARWAHNPKVIGSNPVPATKQKSVVYTDFFLLLDSYPDESVPTYVGRIPACRRLAVPATKQKSVVYTDFFLLLGSYPDVIRSRHVGRILSESLLIHLANILVGCGSKLRPFFPMNKGHLNPLLHRPVSPGRVKQPGSIQG